MRRFARKPVGVAAAAVLLLLVLATVLAGWLAPFGPDEQDIAHAFEGPSGRHPLGTGELGKDVLSRLLHGGRPTLVAVLVSVTVYTVVGVALGIAAGYLGGRVDRLVLRLADLVYAVPGAIVVLLVLATFPNNEPAAMVVVGLLGGVGLARVVRSATLGLRQELYVQAARTSGLGAVTIMRRHVLPGLAGTIIVQVSLFGAAAVMLETALGFLGLGTKEATWGSMVAEASKYLGVHPWLLVPSGTLVVVFVVALGLFGDAVRDATSERRAASPMRPRISVPGPDPERSTEPVAADALLSVRGLHVAFPVDGTPTTVVRDVSFDLHPGEAVGVVGESGCGKTVTAAAVLGLLRGGGRVTAGQVTFEGVDLVGASAEHLRAVRGGRIGWVSQDPIGSLDPSFTVGSQVAEVVRAHRACSRRDAKARALELLAAAQLPEPKRVARSYPHQLSGGMAQRASIAAALAGDPVMLIADEPTTALDVTVQAEILDLLRALQQQGMAVMLVTHDWGVLADVCDRALVMYAGEVVEQALVADMVAAPGHPYTAGLLRSSPFYAVPGEPLTAIEGTVPLPADWPAGCHFQQRCPLATDACATGPVPTVAFDGRSDRLTRCLHSDQLAVVPTGAHHA